MRDILLPFTHLPLLFLRPEGKLVDLGLVQAYTREFSNLFCTSYTHSSRSADEWLLSPVM
jgi:hypothetical protein